MALQQARPDWPPDTTTDRPLRFLKSLKALGQRRSGKCLICFQAQEDNDA